MIKSFGKSLFWGVSNLIGFQYSRFYRTQYAKLCKINNAQALPKDIEDAYRKKWSVLSKNVDVKNLRLFSKYIGVDLNIVPEDIVHNVFEQILNPPAFRPYYEDKNTADKIYPKGSLPQTLLRKINGFFFDADYDTVQRVTDSSLYDLCKRYDKIIIKPTVGTNSGVGVELFTKENDLFYNTKHQKLNIEYLAGLGTDYIIQECLHQSEFMSQFNPTSVNTFRVLAYRSVVTNEVVIPGIVMKIGSKGSYIDNAHAGGIMVGVSQEGKINNYGVDQYGRIYDEFNGVRLKVASLNIPNFSEIISFSKRIASCIPFLRVVNLDIMVDYNNAPKLIECNVNGMSSWYFHFNTGSAFGEYTDEIMAYCIPRLKQINRIRVTY